MFHRFDAKLTPEINEQIKCNMRGRVATKYVGATAEKKCFVMLYSVVYG